jgi:hypothetical protein
MMQQREVGVQRERTGALPVVTLVLAGCLATSCTQPADRGITSRADELFDAGLNVLTPAEEAEGWVLLFDGASLVGWRGLGRDNIPEGHWLVEDGAIRKVASGEVPRAPDGQPLEGGDLMTETVFGDFDLRLEWKVSPGANSGIKYNVSEKMSTSHPPEYAALGFEYQILDDERHPDAAAGPNRTAAALYDLVAPSDDKVARPVGEFNAARIVMRGDFGEHWLNGQLVLEYDIGSSRFDSLLAVSKYHPIVGFSDRREGHIVLQDHGDDVWFRNIKIRELKPAG